MANYLPPPNRIELSEWLERAKSLYEQIPMEETTITGAQTKEMFTLHNDKLLPRETGTSCGGCRLRVYRRLKQYYEQQAGQATTE